MPRTAEELSGLLDEQVRFLRSSAAAYDRGDLAEAKRLATTISTLVNSTRTSKPLLGLMGLSDTMRFLSTSRPLENSFPKLALVIAMMNTHTGASFIPLCASDFIKWAPKAWLSLAQWWGEEPIYQVDTANGTTISVSRCQLTHHIRSQDGGSHIDDEAKGEGYLRLSRESEVGGVFIHNDVEVKAPDGHLAAMRQIAWELDQSLIEAGLAPPELSAGITQ